MSDDTWRWTWGEGDIEIEPAEVNKEKKSSRDPKALTPSPLKSKRDADDADPCHLPPGSPEGGQFTGCEGGGEGGGGGKEAITNAPTDTDRKRWQQQLGGAEDNPDPWKEDAQGFMREALARERTTKLSERRNARFIAIEKNGKLVVAGFARIKGKEGEIVALGSTERGLGQKALTRLEQELKGVKEIKLKASDQNESFYRRNGYERVSVNEEEIYMRKKLK